MFARSLRAGWSLLLLVGAGCGGSDAPPAASAEAGQAPAAAAASAPGQSRAATPPRQPEINGTWSGLLPAGPNATYALKLELSGPPGALNGRLTVGDNLHPPGRPGVYSGMVHEPPLTGRYDPLLRRIALESVPDERQQALHLNGLVSGDGLLLSIHRTGKQRRIGSSMNGLAARADGAFEGIAERIAALAGQRPQADGSGCPGPYLAWIEAEKAARRKRRSPAENYAALDEPGFSRAFGQPYASMPAEALLQAAGILRGSCIVERADHSLVTSLSYLLADARSVRDYLVITRRPVLIEGWVDATAAALAAAPPGAPVDIAALQAIPLNFRFKGTPEAQLLQPVTERLAAEAAARKAMDDYLARVDKAADNFVQLIALGNEARRFAPERAERAFARIGPLLPAAAETYAAQSRTAQHGQFMAGWAAQHRNGEGADCPAPGPKPCARAARHFDRALPGLAEQLVEKEQRFAAKRPIPDGLAGVEALNEAEGQLRFLYRNLLDQPALADYQASLASRRQKLQKSLRDELLGAVKEAPDGRALQQLEARYFSGEDLAQRPMKKINRVLEKRLAEIAPFRGVPGGDYLNALYTGDHRLLRTLDGEYTAGIKPLLKFAVASMSTLAPLMDAVRGEAPGTAAAAMTPDYSKLSVVSGVLGAYLLDYDAMYEDCLPRNAPEFETVRGAERVTKDRFGVERSRVRLWTRRDRYRIPPDMAPYFREVWNTGPDSPDARFMDYMLNDGRSNDLIKGLRRVMQAYDCDAPEIRQLEQGMRGWYDAVNGPAGA